MPERRKWNHKGTGPTSVDFDATGTSRRTPNRKANPTRKCEWAFTGVEITADFERLGRGEGEMGEEGRRASARCTWKHAIGTFDGHTQITWGRAYHDNYG